MKAPRIKREIESDFSTFEISIPVGQSLLMMKNRKSAK